MDVALDEGAVKDRAGGRGGWEVHRLLAQVEPVSVPSAGIGLTIKLVNRAIVGNAPSAAHR